MSYFAASNTGANFGGVRPMTPMIHDIAALQLLYGANLSTRTGDTVYGFHSNTGLEPFSIVNSSDQRVFAIWDAGGNDTIDLSGYTADAKIDLAPGSFSSANGLIGNISIAFDCIIENAIGGSAADNISGNDANNSLYGQGGNDTLTGNGGADLLVGGLGNDIYVIDGADTIVEDISGGTDTVRTSVSDFTLGDNLENLTFTGAGAFVERAMASLTSLRAAPAATRLMGRVGWIALSAGSAMIFTLSTSPLQVLFRIR